MTTSALDRVGTRTAPISERRQDILNMQSQFALALGDQKTAERFVRVALTALSRPPAYPGAATLGDCTRETLLGGLITCAQLRLEPNDPRGLAYLIPFRNNRENTVEAQLVLGYRGLIDLAYRSGQIQTITAETVHEHDEFTFNRWPRELSHRDAPDDRGQAVAYYAAVSYQGGGQDFLVMTKAEVEQWRDLHSKSARKRNGDLDTRSPWATAFDEMAKKTCLRRLAKMMPLSVEDLRVGLAVDGSVQTSLTPTPNDALLASAPAVAIEPGDVAADPETGEVLPVEDPPEPPSDWPKVAEVPQ
jgi:recombination protein RecT